MRDGVSVTVERPAGQKRQYIAISHPHLDLSGANSCERMKANARLIAAAPELYAELQQFVNGVETGMIDSPADETLANITRRAKAALAKARGEA